MTQFQLAFTREELERILLSLGKEPYVQVVDIIESIKKQANEQLKEK